MRQVTILFIFLFLFAMNQTSLKCNEIIDDTYVVVEGLVVKSEEIKKKSIKSSSERSDLFEKRKRRNQQSFQAPPSVTGNETKMRVEVRSYCLRSMTSRGTPTRIGVIAVDPRVIPFGSKIYVPGYGWGTALDTGSGIKGYSIDIWMPTYSQCMQWGVRNVKITVIKPK